MCGIAGYTAVRGERVDRATAAAMNEALLHRGPDEGGVADLAFAALAMRRLAIVDVRDGHQPMVSDDGRWTLVYNGELYDFAAQRKELEARGEVFRTRSDTEVLLHAWALDGERALERCNGMFAFAIADARERTLVLARDPLGIKPLYYFHGPRGELVFASELSSLLAHPAVPRRLDRASLEMLLVDRYVADPWTLLEGVRQLPPGHTLTWRDGKIALRRYAELRFEPEPMDEEPATEELRAILDATVRSQLVADVPVGVFLSGGIDSSTVAAFAARQSSEPLQTFSVGFARAAYDESALAREVAHHLGATHREVRIEDARFELELFDAILDHVGQPLGDTSCIPTWIVSRLASEHVKVVLSGDGGDEFFGGYDHMFWAGRVRRMAERTPALVRHLGRAVLAGVAPIAPAGLAQTARRARKGVELSFLEPAQQFRRLRSLWTENEVAALCAHESRATQRLEPLGRTAGDETLAPEELAMSVLARTFMPGAILPKVDRMSMAASLEVRPPLLDRRVVDFAMRVPLRLKLRNGVGKHLLREAGRRYLPASVYDHPKQGFSIPLFGWFNAQFWELVDDSYAPKSRAAALFHAAPLAKALANGRSADRDTRRVSESAAATRVWLLAQLARWMDRFEVSA